MKFLLENGAKHEMKDFMGQTALHNAAEKGHLDIAMDLIEHGAQFLPDNKNLTPLHVACDFNHVELVKEFLELPQFSVLDRIHALELLGASYCNGSEDYNIQMAYRWVWKRYCIERNRIGLLVRSKVYDNKIGLSKFL